MCNVSVSHRELRHHHHHHQGGNNVIVALNVWHFLLEPANSLNYNLTLSLCINIFVVVNIIICKGKKIKGSSGSSMNNSWRARVRDEKFEWNVLLSTN